MGTGEQDKQARDPGIPRGIEVLVKKASVDPAFRAVLLERRAKAADEIGLTLTPAEVVMIDSIPAEQLQAIINRTKVDASKLHLFLGISAAAMLAAAGAAVVMDVHGLQGQSRGIRPDLSHGVRPDISAPAQPGTQPASQPKTDISRKDVP